MVDLNAPSLTAVLLHSGGSVHMETRAAAPLITAEHTHCNMTGNTLSALTVMLLNR